MSAAQVTPPPASPKIASMLMIATYIAGAAGLFVGFWSLSKTPPSLSIAALLAVGLGGGLSFVRHSIFHKSDAARIGWVSAERNNFQIEVGLANLAWALLAVGAVVFKWGLAVEAAAFLVFGFYLTACAVMIVTSSSSGNTRRAWGPVIGMAVFGIMLIVIGFQGMQAA